MFFRSGAYIWVTNRFLNYNWIYNCFFLNTNISVVLSLSNFNALVTINHSKCQEFSLTKRFSFFLFFLKNTQINIHKYSYCASTGICDSPKEYVIRICWNKDIFSRVFCFRSCGWGPFIEETCLKLWKSVELRWDQHRKDIMLFYSWKHKMCVFLVKSTEPKYVHHTLPEISNISSKSNRKFI